MTTSRASPLVPFQYATFRAIWLANLASSFGALIQGVGAAWLMTSIANSVDMVALVQASTSLPIMLFSLVGGAIADSFNRRNVMLAAQLFMAVISALLMAGTYLGMISPWLLLTFTFLIGCGAAINNPSWQAAVGELVPRTDLHSAVALNSIGFNLSRSVGPAVGGLIVAAAGAAAAFLVNTLSYVALIAVLLRWKPEPQPTNLPRESMGAAMMSGLRYVAMSPKIGMVLLRAAVFGCGAIVILALLPVVSASKLGGGPLTYGLMLGAFGVGAIGGALVSSLLHQRMSSEWVVRLAFLCSAAATFVVGFSTNPLLTAAALLLSGAGWVLALSLFNVSVQLASPRWVLGRALSIYQTATFAGMAGGSWLWGVIAESYDLTTALVAAGCVLLGGVALGFVLPIAQRSVLNLDPLNRWKEPQIELAIEPRSGPIVIEITYTIPHENIADFLLAMADRKRIRRRDGARHWVLMRDLHNPDRWVESYRTPTWTEYVRHNQRTTQADAAISERLRALQAGAEPQVRRMIERPPNWFAMAMGPKSTIDPH